MVSLCNRQRNLTSYSHDLPTRSVRGVPGESDLESAQTQRARVCSLLTRASDTTPGLSKSCGISALPPLIYQRLPSQHLAQKLCQTQRIAMEGVVRVTLLIVGAFAVMVIILAVAPAVVDISRDTGKQSLYKRV